MLPYSHIFVTTLILTRSTSMAVDHHVRVIHSEKCQCTSLPFKPIIYFNSVSKPKSKKFINH